MEKYHWSNNGCGDSAKGRRGSHHSPYFCSSLTKDPRTINGRPPRHESGHESSLGWTGRSEDHNAMDTSHAQSTIALVVAAELSPSTGIIPLLQQILHVTRRLPERMIPTSTTTHRVLYFHKGYLGLAQTDGASSVVLDVTKPSMSVTDDLAMIHSMGTSAGTDHGVMLPLEHMVATLRRYAIDVLIVVGDVSGLFQAYQIAQFLRENPTGIQERSTRVLCVASHYEALHHAVQSQSVGYTTLMQSAVALCHAASRIADAFFFRVVPIVVRGAAFALQLAAAVGAEVAEVCLTMDVVSHYLLTEGLERRTQHECEDQSDMPSFHTEEAPRRVLECLDCRSRCVIIMDESYVSTFLHTVEPELRSRCPYIEVLSPIFHRFVLNATDNVLVRDTKAAAVLGQGMARAISEGRDQEFVTLDTTGACVTIPLYTVLFGSQRSREVLKQWTTSMIHYLTAASRSVRSIPRVMHGSLMAIREPRYDAIKYAIMVVMNPGVTLLCIPALVHALVLQLTRFHEEERWSRSARNFNQLTLEDVLRVKENVQPGGQKETVRNMHLVATEYGLEGGMLHRLDQVLGRTSGSHNSSVEFNSKQWKNWKMPPQRDSYSRPESITPCEGVSLEGRTPVVVYGIHNGLLGVLDEVAVGQSVVELSCHTQRPLAQIPGHHPFLLSSANYSDYIITASAHTEIHSDDMNRCHAVLVDELKLRALYVIGDDLAAKTVKRIQQLTPADQEETFLVLHIPTSTLNNSSSPQAELPSSQRSPGPHCSSRVLEQPNTHPLYEQQPSIQEKAGTNGIETDARSTGFVEGLLASSGPRAVDCGVSSTVLVSKRTLSEPSLRLFTPPLTHMNRAEMQARNRSSSMLQPRSPGKLWDQPASSTVPSEIMVEGYTSSETNPVVLPEPSKRSPRMQRRFASKKASRSVACDVLGRVTYEHVSFLALRQYIDGCCYDGPIVTLLRGAEHLLHCSWKQNSGPLARLGIEHIFVPFDLSLSDPELDHTQTLIGIAQKTTREILHLLSRPSGRAQHVLVILCKNPSTWGSSSSMEACDESYTGSSLGSVRLTCGNEARYEEMLQAYLETALGHTMPFMRVHNYALDVHTLTIPHLLGFMKSEVGRDVLGQTVLESAIPSAAPMVSNCHEKQHGCESRTPKNSIPPASTSSCSSKASVSSSSPAPDATLRYATLSVPNDMNRCQQLVSTAISQLRAREWVPLMHLIKSEEMMHLISSVPLTEPIETPRFLSLTAALAHLNTLRDNTVRRGRPVNTVNAPEDNFHGTPVQYCGIRLPVEELLGLGTQLRDELSEGYFVPLLTSTPHVHASTPSPPIEEAVNACEESGEDAHNHRRRVQGCRRRFQCDAQHSKMGLRKTDVGRRSHRIGTRLLVIAEVNIDDLSSEYLAALETQWSEHGKEWSFRPFCTMISVDTSCYVRDGLELIACAVWCGSLARHLGAGLELRIQPEHLLLSEHPIVTAASTLHSIGVPCYSFHLDVTERLLMDEDYLSSLHVLQEEFRSLPPPSVTRHLSNCKGTAGTTQQVDFKERIIPFSLTLVDRLDPCYETESTRTGKLSSTEVKSWIVRWKEAGATMVTFHSFGTPPSLSERNGVRQELGATPVDEDPSERAHADRIRTEKEQEKKEEWNYVHRSENQPKDGTRKKFLKDRNAPAQYDHTEESAHYPLI